MANTGTGSTGTEYTRSIPTETDYSTRLPEVDNYSMLKDGRAHDV